MSKYNIKKRKDETDLDCVKQNSFELLWECLD